MTPDPKPPKHRKRKRSGRLNGLALKRFRDAVLYRDGYACVNPNCECRTNPTLPSICYLLSIHHRQKRSQGGSDTIGNCVTLCNLCHDLVEKHKLSEDFIDEYLEGMK